MPIAEQGQVELNGNLYYVNGAVQRVKSDITPFSPKFGSGPPKYSDFAIASYQPYRDFRSGMSLLYGREDKAGRYWHATTDMRFPYQVTLPPLSVATTAAYANGHTIFAFHEIAGKVVGFSNSENFVGGLWSYTVGTNTWTLASNPFTPVMHLLGLARYTPPGGSDSLYTFGYIYTGGGTSQYAYSTNGTSWTAKTAPAAILRLMVSFNGYLVAFGEDGIYKSNDPATPTWTTVISGMPGRPIAACVYVDEQGDEAIYFVTGDALWRLNFFSGTLTLCRQFEAGAISAINQPDPTGGLMVVHNGALMIATVRGVLRYTNTSQAWIGPNRDDGLEVGYQGIVSWLFSDVEKLWCSIAMGSTGQTGQYAQILVYDEFGWHRIYTYTGSVSVFRLPFLLSTINASAGYTRFFIAVLGSGDVAPQYFEIPFSNPNPLQLTTPTYAASGFIITPWDDLNFAEIPKGAYELAVNYRLRNTDSSILIEYAIDNEATYTPLGTITGASDLLLNNKTLYFGASNQGIAFNLIRFRATLTQASSITTTTPVLLYFTLKYIARPTTRFSWFQDIDLSEDACEALGKTYEQVLTELETARASVPLVTFRPYGQYAADMPAAKRVLVTSMPSYLTELLEHGTRYGSVRLTVAEVV